MNVCIFIGNLTRDPEMRYTPSGAAVTEFSIAINGRQGDKETVEYVDFSCWDKLAESVAEYARKGRKIGVESAHHTEHWETQEGAKRSRVRYRAYKVEFLDAPPKRDDQEPREQARVSPLRQEATHAQEDPGPSDEDLANLKF